MRDFLIFATGIIVAMVTTASLTFTYKDSRTNDAIFLNQTITTITNKNGVKVNITRKHLLDFIILKNIEELKQKQVLEQPDGR